MEKAKVYYLCRDPKNTEGLIFAAELEEYDYAPGLFVVESKTGWSLDDEYVMRARRGQEVMSFRLLRTVDRRIFKVETIEFGTFLFKAISLDAKYRYSGKQRNVFKLNRLWRIEPANFNHLEEVCLKHDFYFIGSNE